MPSRPSRAAWIISRTLDLPAPQSPWIPTVMGPSARSVSRPVIVLAIASLLSRLIFVSLSASTPHNSLSIMLSNYIANVGRWLGSHSRSGNPTCPRPAPRRWPMKGQGFEPGTPGSPCRRLSEAAEPQAWSSSKPCSSLCERLSSTRAFQSSSRLPPARESFVHPETRFLACCSPERPQGIYQAKRALDLPRQLLVFRGINGAQDRN